MPSWNIHTAHVERLFADNSPAALGIADPNAFLFGNYVPDIYLGFMVTDTTYRIDYCLTHLAVPDIVPVPGADQFWDECVWHSIRRPKTPEGVSLALGAWAHLVADGVYNARFRLFCKTHEVPSGDELRKRKQADFSLFGCSLAISSHVSVTPSLLEAARSFRPYSVLPADVARAVEVANAIVDTQGRGPQAGCYQLLDADWMSGAFEACNEHIAAWLAAYCELARDGEPYSAADVRARVG